MTTRGICLEPLDVLFFRDGRPFSAATRAATGLPTPQTLAGALRTALLEKYRCGFERLRGATDFVAAVAEAFPDCAWIGRVAFRGLWFACWKEKPSRNLKVLVPAPGTLHRAKKEEGARLFRLRPLKESELPGWCPDGRPPTPRPLWLRGRDDTEPADGFLTPDGLAAFLGDKDVAEGDFVPRSDLFEYDYRTGIGIEPDRLTAQESIIYGVSFLAPQRDVGLYAEVLLPDDAPKDALADIPVVALGGEGRRARLDVLPEPFGWSSATPSKANEKPLLLLTTPGLFAGRWKPASLARLVAAAVPSPLAVSGWDLARNGPRPTRFAAPAGSVYFLDSPADGLPDALTDVSDPPDAARQGWGCYLRGVWTDD